MAKTSLSNNAIKTLEKDLRRTRGFALPRQIHDEIENVLKNLAMDDIEKLFKEHQKVLVSLEVTGLTELLKM